MSITAVVSMCKDEADVVDGFVRWMSEQADFLIIADNSSTDGTRDLLSDLARDFPLTVVDDPEVGYFQSRKMTALAKRAREHGADFVIPADQDERWYSPFGRIGDVLAEHDGASIFTAALYDHVATGRDPDEQDPVTRIGWRRREHAPLAKVAVRSHPALTIHQGNHSADFAGTGGATIHDLLIVRHFPYRSVEQFVSKVRNGAAAYAATDLPLDAGAHWRQYGQILAQSGPEALGDVFRTWFWSARPEADEDLIFDPARAACPSPS